MQSPTFQPLLAVGREYVRDVSPNIADEEIEHLSSVMNRYIMNQVTYEYAFQYFERSLGSVIPIQRIAAILYQCNIPPTSMDARFHQAQALSGLGNKKMRQWTEIEDQRLLSGIHKYGTDNWAMVANHLGNTRTRAQCSQRWFRGLDPRIVKATWTTEEENTLLELVEHHGDHSWTKIANTIGNRSDAQCRYHYYQLLKEKQGQKLRKRSRHPKIPTVMSAPQGSLGEMTQQLEIKRKAVSDQDSEESCHIEKLPSISDLLSSLPQNSPFIRTNNITGIIKL